MKTEFINVAAHELRTPVQPILGLSEVLRSKINDIEQLSYLDVINRNAKRLLQLANDILDVTKIESQSLRLTKETFALQELVASIVNEYDEIIKKSNINIKLRYISNSERGNKPILVEADRGRISQVISNLISNALKFTQEGSIIITSEIKDDENAIVVSVKDTGAGIDSEILPKLFTKFASKSFAGTGLGLYISKSIVGEHGGKIWAQNNADGNGATFYFSLPLKGMAISYKI
jgi:signal transduction histidine kinase